MNGPQPADVLQLRFPLDAALSPDGNTLAYSLAATEGDPARDTVSLCLLDIPSGKTRTVSSAASPAWSPKGDQLAVLAVLDGVPRLCTVDAQSLELKTVTSAAAGLARPSWSPDGRHLAFTAGTAPQRDPAAPYRVTSPLWRLDGLGLIDDHRQEVFVTEVGSGEARALTSHGGITTFVSWSPNGEKVLYAAFAERDEQRFVVRAVSTGNEEAPTTYYDEEFYVAEPAIAWLPDGSVICSTDGRAGLERIRIQIHGPDGSTRSLALPQDGWTFGMVQGDFPFTVFQRPRLVLAPDGASVFVHVLFGGASWIYRLWLDGREGERVVHGDGVHIPFGFDGEELVYGRTTITEPPDFHTLRIGTSDGRRLTHLGDQLLADTGYEVRQLSFTSSDGAPVEAWYLRPQGAAGPLPTVVSCHGGPSYAVWGHAFNFDHLMLAGAGFGVLLPNPRGSTGYDPEFASASQGQWGHLEFADLMAAVDTAVDAGLADPERLAVYGISAGAFLSGWAITHTDRFRCAVLESPSLNWAAMIGADVGPLFMGWIRADAGTGEQAAARYAAASVTTYAANCTTPTLLIQSENDQRTPSGQSDEMYALLHSYGCPVEMLRIPGSPHASSIALGNPRARQTCNEALLEWIERHLRVFGR